jgi:hypothetical protein
VLTNLLNLSSFSPLRHSGTKRDSFSCTQNWPALE